MPPKVTLVASMLGLFLAAVIGAGVVLLRLPEPHARPLADSAHQPTSAPATLHRHRDQRFVIKRILPIAGPIKYGEWHWDARAVPDGPIVITVDLEARVLSIFKDGYEIGAAAVLLGTSEKPTPLGVFPVAAKRREYYSATYDNAPMPFAMRLTDDGVAIHGTSVKKGYASHGCIGVPTAFAARIFAATPLGTNVYITRGRMLAPGDSLIGD